MQYDKAMIDLVLEIRRRVSSEDKPAIKLANPELFDELVRIYRASTDAVTRALVKDLFARAGDPWPQSLEAPQADGPRYVSKVYRGQVRLEEADGPKTSSEERPVRIYRGRVVS